MDGEAWSVRTTHAKVFQGTDEALGLLGGVFPFYGTENILLGRQQSKEILRDLGLLTYRAAGSSHT